jgi:hypothetical protein
MTATMNRTKLVGRTLRVAGATLLALIFTLGASACTTCAGVSVCGDAVVLSFQGQVLQRNPWHAIPGAEVTFLRRGGAEVDRDSIVVVSDARGLYEIHTGVSGRGTVMADFRVRPPAPLRTVEIRNVEIRPTRSGDIMFLGPLFVDTEP